VIRIKTQVSKNKVFKTHVLKTYLTLNFITDTNFWQTNLWKWHVSCWEIFSIVNRWAYLIHTSPSTNINSKKPCYIRRLKPRPINKYMLKPIQEQLARSQEYIENIKSQDTWIVHGSWIARYHPSESENRFPPYLEWTVKVPSINMYKLSSIFQLRLLIIRTWYKFSPMTDLSIRVGPTSTLASLFAVIADIYCFREKNEELSRSLCYRTKNCMSFNKWKIHFFFFF
jgi:hypothetical protein